MTATTSTDLASFLLARLSEDEEAAREATPGPWTAYGDGVVLGTSENPEVCRGVKSWNLAHVATFDPARVLADCAAKRAILDELEDSMQRKDIYNRSYDAGELSTPDDVRFRLDANVRWAAQEAVVRLLVSAYRDHPDYDPDWP